jgi:hypothetical protein
MGSLKKKFEVEDEGNLLQMDEDINEDENA